GPHCAVESYRYSEGRCMWVVQPNTDHPEAAGAASGGRAAYTTWTSMQLHEKASGHRNVDGMGSIRSSQLQHDFLHVGLHGCLRDRQVRGDDLVGRTASDFAKNLDFALSEIIFRIVLSEFSGDFLGDISPSDVNGADGLQQLGPNHVFQDVSSRACLQR